MNDKIRADRVAALEFFLGGAAVLELAGGPLNARSFARSCDLGGTGVDCAWFAAHGVDLRKVDDVVLGRAGRDLRIGAVIAVDPESSAHFTAASLAAIDVPVTVINRGEAATRPPGRGASGLGTAIPSLRYAVVPDATPFSVRSAAANRKLWRSLRRRANTTRSAATQAHARAKSSTTPWRRPGHDIPVVVGRPSAQAWPAVEESSDGSTPILRSAPVHLSASSSSKTIFWSGGAMSQPFFWISASSWPGAQPA